MHRCLGESSLVVERCLAKAKAEGSIPFFRLFEVLFDLVLGVSVLISFYCFLFYKKETQRGEGLFFIT